MQRDLVWAIARKDLGAVTSNSQVWAPMAIVPALLGVLMPTLAATITAHRATATLNPADEAKLREFLQKLDLPSIASQPTLTHAMVDVGANYLLAPLFLIIPLMVSSVMTAESFAGEKERGTLESLLYSPVELGTLYAGKILAALLPSLVISLGSLALCALGLNLGAWSLFHRVFFPTLNWLPLVVLVIPALSFATILVNVFVSARVATFQAAYQLGGLVVLPLILLVAGQATGLLLLSTAVVTGAGVALVLLDVVLVRLLIAGTSRARLFETQVR